MNNVIPITAIRRSSDDQRTRFGLARRDMNRAFNAWLDTKPDPIDVQSEIDDTMNVLRQLRDLRAE